MCLNQMVIWVERVETKILLLYKNIKINKTDGYILYNIQCLQGKMINK